MSPNTFHDINTFPNDWGIIVLGISMSRIMNGQSPKECMDALEHFLPKIRSNQVGANFVYTDGLYMNFEQDAFLTKKKFAQESVAHMGGVRNLIAKNSDKFQINHAFNFETWFQMYLTHSNFFGALKKVRDLYDADAEFQHWVKVDTEEAGRELTERQLSFFLEEHTLDYLLINRQLRLRNDFVNDREKWVLNTYHGKPPKAHIYLYQKDPLKINGDTNKFKGLYDLTEKKFIDYNNVDLSTL